MRAVVVLLDDLDSLVGDTIREQKTLVTVFGLGKLSSTVRLLSLFLFFILLVCTRDATL